MPVVFQLYMSPGRLGQAVAGEGDNRYPCSEVSRDSLEREQPV